MDSRAPTTDTADRVATALGWFSIALGTAQLVAPGGVARLVGARDDARTRTVMRGLGLRELTAGLGILASGAGSEGRAGWVWSRVAGDTMDLALLGNVARGDDAERGRTLGATMAVLGVTALDAWCARELSGDGATRAGVEAERGIHVRRSITVGCTRAEAYAFWHDFENLPRFMRHLQSVQVTGEGRSRWVALAPAGRTVEWEAEVTEDRPDELIAWRSLPGADVANEGRVRFADAPGGRGTEVRVELRYDPPGGRLGAAVAKLFREEPRQQVADDLRRFKQVMETGDVVLSDATFARGPHSGQPPAELPPEARHRSFEPAPGRTTRDASEDALADASTEGWDGPITGAAAGSRTGDTDYEDRARGGAAGDRGPDARP